MTLRELGVLTFGGVVVALSPRRRALVAQEWAQSRRLVFQRIEMHERTNGTTVVRNEGASNAVI